MLIGLTGGIGSGKSTVAAMFNKYGLPIVDADYIARRVVEPNQPAWKKIVAYFGSDILLPDNTIDRKKLGEIVFNDEQKRNKLNEITHPIIISELMDEARALELVNGKVIVDIPLLFESKREELFEYIVVVYVSYSTQVKRLMGRDQITLEEAKSRISAQMSLDEKKAGADFVIYNDEDLAFTEEQVKNILNKFS